MDIWGERYAEVDLFIGYCTDLNVKTDRRELEHYEKIGVMLPIARVVYPDDYAIQTYKAQFSRFPDPDVTAMSPDLSRLLQGLSQFSLGYGDMGNEELAHCFDREIQAGGNPHLSLPSSTDFQPWSDYSVIASVDQGHEIRQPTAKHYYGYWQVHQLAYIQRYPDLYRYAGLIARIPKDDPVRNFYPMAPNSNVLANFNGMRGSFDALSFWITGYVRERNRTFANIPESNGIKRLDDDQTSAHTVRLTAFAEKVTERFQITKKDLYGFLHKLIELMEGYERKERSKLAEALKRDIFAWEDLLTLTTGETRDEVADELGKVDPYHERTFRHLDIMTKERDYTFDLLNRAAKQCAIDLQRLGDSEWSFSETDVNDLLDYCERNGLGLFATAMSGMVAIGEEERRRNFRRVQMYSNLKNVLNSYEYLLKSIMIESGLISGRETLTPLVGKVMEQEPWSKLFKAKTNMTRGNHSGKFLENLHELLSDDQLGVTLPGYWARKFLILCLARNMTVHSHPSEDSYYGDLFGPMLNAAVISTFYTWRLAKAKGWVKVA